MYAEPVAHSLALTTVEVQVLWTSRDRSCNTKRRELDCVRL